METFICSIKTKYQEKIVTKLNDREDQWPLCCSNKLIRLELVERSKSEIVRGFSVPLDYWNLFKVDRGMEQVRKVLVEGDAGIGKTTLCTLISKDWANDKILQQFQLLLLLPLRHKKVASANSLSELLKILHGRQKVCNSVADSLEENEGKGTLIIADGWDELSEYQQQEGSFIFNLLLGDLLPFVSLILTSRPTVSASLHKLSCIDRLAVVRGFCKESISEYILSEFATDQEKAKRLLQELQSNPLIEDVCIIPINCAIVCHLWRTLEESLPTTMTELYTKIIRNVLFRNIRKKAYTDILCLHSFSALPEDLQQPWWLLCKFAFEALKKDQLIFSREELVQFFPHYMALDEKVLCFGLLQSSNPVSETGWGVSFHFLHLTFQEYLAAMHLVRELPIKQDACDQLTTELEIFQRDDVLKRFSVVLRFCFGLSYCSELGQSRCSFIRSLLNSMSNRHIHGDKDLFLCHCALEAKNDKLIITKVIQLFQNIRPGLNIRFGQPRTAYDCAAILHVISNMHECRGMKIEFNNSGVKENQIGMLTDILSSKQDKVQVKELCLGYNMLTDRCVSDLFCRASASFYFLENIDLGNNRIGAGSIKSIILKLERPPYSGLSKLDLSNNFLGVSGLQALENVQFSPSIALLHELHLRNCLTSDADINGALLTTSFEIVLTYCFYLSNLDLSNNNLGIPGASALARIISQYYTLKDEANYEYVIIMYRRTWSLHLNEVNLSDKGLCSFVECLEHRCRFCELELNSNGISAIGVTCLAQAVTSGKIVMIEHKIRGDVEETNNLDLSNNPLGILGAIAVCKILSSYNFQLEEANLSNCQLASVSSNQLLTASYMSSVNGDAIRAIGQQLCRLVQNDTIRYLDLRNNTFTGEGIHVLAAFMYLCPSVEDMRTINCGITSDDLRQLLNRLTELKHTKCQNPCRKLETWHLSMNEIDDSGVLAVVECLSSLFPCLGYGIGAVGDGIFLHNNLISNDCEGMRRLREEMKRRRSQSLEVKKS